MAQNSSMQVQHACGTCGALLGSIAALNEHAQEHTMRDHAPGQSDTETVDPWSDDEGAQSPRGPARRRSATT